MIRNTNTRPRKPAQDKRPWNKIARLPKALRDKINHMLDDGFTYSKICRELAADVPTLNKMDLTRWKRGGHQAWLREQQHLAIVQSRFDHITDLLAATNQNKLPADLLALASIRLAEFLAQLDSAELLNGAQSDPKILLRLLGILPRIARESLNQRKYNETGPPAQLELKDPDRDLVQTENEALVRRLDRALGVKGPIHFIKPRIVEARPAASPSPGAEGRPALRSAFPTDEALLAKAVDEGGQGNSIPHSALPTLNSEREDPTTIHNS